RLLLVRDVAGGHPLLERVHLRLQREQGRESLAGLFEDRAAGVLDAVLRQVPDGEIGGTDDRAAVRLLESGEHAPQGRLAGAVRSAEADTLAVVDLPRHVVEQDALAERLGETGKLDHAGRSRPAA